MWWSWIEIKYSILYFERITKFDTLYSAELLLSGKGSAHMHFINISDIQTMVALLLNHLNLVLVRIVSR